jgi:hypothetical protein
MNVDSGNDTIIATKKLSEMGLPVPPSFVVTKQNYPNLQQAILKYDSVKYWYLRSVRQEEDVLTTRVVTNANIGSVLGLAFSLNPTAKIVVQERVDVSYSGVLAVGNGIIFIEYIKGGLKGLLRDGVTPSSMVFDLSGEVLTNQIKKQEFWYSWEGDELLARSSVTPEPLAETTQMKLLDAAHKSQEPSVYEWVQDQARRVFFIDIKSIPSASLENKALMLDCINHETIIILDLPIRGKIVKNHTDISKGVFLIEKPLYGYIGEVLRRASAVVSLSGGILSHLLVYAAKENIPGIISPVLFEKLSEMEEINIPSVSALFNTISN